MKFTPHEIELLKHALYLHRELVRESRRLAAEDPSSDRVKRDIDRFDKIVRASLRLTGKLDDLRE